jgi:hypothetical protein
MLYNSSQGKEICPAFTSSIFILVRVAHKSNPDDGMEAMGDRKGPMAFSF